VGKISGTGAPIRPATGSVHRKWRATQAASVMGMCALLWLLIFEPQVGLFLTWWVLVPLIPLILLYVPHLWRNACPIAVLHQLPAMAGKGGRRRLSIRTHRWAPGIAALALFFILPLRHLIFNDHGPALAAFLVAVLALAVGGGLLFVGKSGWCSTFCPLGPVEKLYGQDPWFYPSRAHCPSCVGCTKACFDLKGGQAVGELLGAAPTEQRKRGSGSALNSVDNDAGDKEEIPGPTLLGTPTGIFAGAFPGFVLGFFAVDPTAGAGILYLHFATFALASLALMVLAQRLFHKDLGATARTAAALAAAIYYAFAVPGAIQAMEGIWVGGPLPSWVTWAGQGLLIGLVVRWWLGPGSREKVESVPALPPGY
jgi:nitrite reductase (NADH) large subunit